MNPVKLLALVAAIGFCIPAFNAQADALDNWSWRNPLPNGNPRHAMNGVTFGNGQFIAVGVGGTVSLSTDTTNWTEHATAVTNALNAVLYTNGLFIAVGDGGSVETSADGLNWVAGSSGTAVSLKSVAFSGGTYAAVGATGVIITSANGLTWTPQTSGTGTDFKGIASGNYGFIAIASTNAVFFSPNGATWTNQLFPAGVHDVILSVNGGYVIGSHQTAGSITPHLFASTNGLNWTTNTFTPVSAIPGFRWVYLVASNNTVFAAGRIPPLYESSTDGGVTWASVTPTSEAGLILAATYGNGTYVGVVNTGVICSTDTLTWTNRALGPFGPTDTLTSIAYGNSNYVASGNTVILSTNGLTYTNLSGTPALNLIRYFSSGFMGVGNDGKLYQSGDGLSWTQRNAGTPQNLNGVASGASLHVAVGNSGAIQTSPTGTIWTSRTSGTSLDLRSITYSNGLFVTVGHLGTVLTSPNGINWDGQDSGQLNSLAAITCGSVGFVAVGDAGTLLTSPDGTNWTARTSGTTSNLTSVTYANGYYLVTGDKAIVKTSYDGVTWTTRNLGATANPALYGSAFLNNRFVVVGASGTILESDIVSPLCDLQIHPPGNWFTLLSLVGNSVRIQACTNLTNWADVTTLNPVTPATLWTNSDPMLDRRFYRAVSP